MKYILYILSLALLLASCTASKKSMQTSVTHTVDTLTKASTKEQTSNVEHKSQVRTTDSTIGISGKEVEGGLKKEDAEPSTAPNGKKRPVYQEAKTNGLLAWVKIDTNGNIKFGAKSDSLTLVIKNLQQQVDSYKTNTHTTQVDTTIRVSQQSTVQQKETVKTRSFWASNWYWIVIAVAVCVAWVFIKTYFKR